MCFNQVVGINCIEKMPSLIAKYLKLSNFDAYIHWSLFSKNFEKLHFLLMRGAIYRHRGWKSLTVAEGYVEDSINNKLSNTILDCEISGSSAITLYGNCLHVKNGYFSNPHSNITS
ncbi:hypothetical protein NQ317_002643 [Molorchus minor]|uniref:Uncharacterized protein n=1 Tax=Molorchus minor TaxID=1323400 RepID=A0ABQ9IY64_9CUCU|nr:hypothetical protein NQ317_002643 [Molorchus minor]